MATAPLSQTLLITNSGVFTQPSASVTVPTGPTTPTPTPTANVAAYWSAMQ